MTGDLPRRDERTRERRAEQVLALVDGRRPQRGKRKVAEEHVAQVLDDHVVGANRARAFLEVLELVTLPDVGAVADHLAAMARLAD